MPNFKYLVHEEIFTLCYNSKGAFTQDIVYNLPVQYRKMYLNFLVKALHEESERMKKSTESSDSSFNTKTKRFGPAIKR